MKQVAKVSGKFQTTIPAAVRRALGIHPGDRIVFDYGDEDASAVTVRRYPTLDEVAGTVPVPEDARALTWSEIRDRAWAAPRGPRRSSRR